MTNTNSTLTALTEQGRTARLAKRGSLESGLAAQAKALGLKPSKGIMRHPATGVGYSLLPMAGGGLIVRAGTETGKAKTFTVQRPEQLAPVVAHLAKLISRG